jgi:hypothetical protein
MARDSSLNLVVGIILIVLGVLLILDKFTLNALFPYAGIVLLVGGILVLIRVLPGGNFLGIVAVVIGVLMLRGFLDQPNPGGRAAGGFWTVLNVVAGAILLALGIGRLRR